ncbi:hypothetical protein J6590_105440, partial [Homalodisca vitripennis]
TLFNVTLLYNLCGQRNSRSRCGLGLGQERALYYHSADRPSPVTQKTLANLQNSRWSPQSGQQVFCQLVSRIGDPSSVRAGGSKWGHMRAMAGDDRLRPPHVFVIAATPTLFYASIVQTKCSLFQLELPTCKIFLKT